MTAADPNIRWLTYHGEKWEVRRGDDGFWRDDAGCLYAFADARASIDPHRACGVAPFDLPDWTPWMRELNNACGSMHDYAYSSPVYQAFHTRAEADAALETSIETAAGGRWWGALADPFWAISRLVGGFFWENDKTR